MQRIVPTAAKVYRGDEVMNKRPAEEAVETYLEVLRQLPTESVDASVATRRRSLSRVNRQLQQSVRAVERLRLLQEREDLFLEVVRSEQAAEKLASAEAAFIEVADAYGMEMGISYSTWREFGVPKHVLERANIKRTRRAVPITEDAIAVLTNGVDEPN